MALFVKIEVKAFYIKIYKKFFCLQCCHLYLSFILFVFSDGKPLIHRRLIGKMRKQ